MHLEVGQVLSGTLRLKKKVAQGGMGTVWIAHHLVLGTDVAVKVMAMPWSSVPSSRTRFLREARMTAKIDSPHVVRCLDCRFTESDEPYLVLELLHGEDLEQRVRHRGLMPLADVVEIIAQSCEALQAIHGAGLVHRDLKPENVYLVDGLRPLVKILDFGVSKPADPSECLDVDKLACGTPQYMSPEHMFEPETTDARSDLFSLAAIAYFTLTGHTPFEADSIEGLYLAIDSGRFLPVTERRPELPAAIDGWFTKALANRPQDRYGDARSMAAALYDALRDARADQLTSAREAETTVRPSWMPTQPDLGEALGVPRKKTTRRPAVLIALAAAVLALAVGDALGVGGSASASPQVADVPDATVEGALTADQGEVDLAP